jgi:hypothetical protein
MLQGLCFPHGDAPCDLNSCEVTWSGFFTDSPVVAPGSLPGLLTLVQLDGYGWQIISYQPC